MKNVPFWQWQDDGLSLKLYVQPNAKKSEISGIYDGALKIRLAAPAVEGKANTALIYFLSEYFNVPKKAVTLLQGAQGRHKRVHIVIAKDQRKKVDDVLKNLQC